MRRSYLPAAAGTLLAALLPTFAAHPAGAAGTATTIVNRETVKADLSPTGKVEHARLFSQILVEGDGVVRVVDPISGENLRDLDGFAKPSVEGGTAVWTVDVDGTARRRAVSDFTGALPVEVRVEYALDGREITPGALVGKSGRLEVTYHVRNVTATPTEVEYRDGRGVRRTAVVPVVMPYVGQLHTVLPPRFTDLTAPRADVAGDGRGGALLAWTMVLFEPVGAVEQTFGWSAEVHDAELPEAQVQLVPVPPKRKPEIRFAEDGFRDGARRAAELTLGADEIDANLAKLRDGASDLYSGLLRLSAGADRLKAGLAEAAAGSSTLADGLGDAAAGGADLADGLGDLAANAGELAAGLTAAKVGGFQVRDGADLLGQGVAAVAAGAGALAAGAGEVAAGADAVATGADALAAGAGGVATGADAVASGAASVAAGIADLSDALDLISGGLGRLAAVDGLPVAEAGAAALHTGVQGLAAVLGDEATPGTVLYGVKGVVDGLAALSGGVGAAKGGVDAVLAGLDKADAADPGAAQVIAGLQSAVTTQAGLLDTLAGALCPLSPLCAHVTDALDANADLVGGLAGLAAGTAEAVTALGGVSSGLGTALANVGGLSTAMSGVRTGVLGVSEALTTQIEPGLDGLVDGLHDAVTVIGLLSSGASDAALGAGALADGAGDLAAGAGDLLDGAGDLAAGAGDLAAGAGDLLDGAGDLAAGAGDLADGAGDLLDGAGDLAGGAGDLADGLADLDAGGGLLGDGAATAADGAADLVDGLGRLAAGAGDLADGLGAAGAGADGVAGGLDRATPGGKAVADGAGNLAKDGTSVLADRASETSGETALHLARLEALDARAATGGLPYGAPAGGTGSGAYLYTLAASRGQAAEDVGRILLALLLLGATAAGGRLARSRREPA